jgi:hypothetical protein
MVAFYLRLQRSKASVRELFIFLQNLSGSDRSAACLLPVGKPVPLARFGPPRRSINREMGTSVDQFLKESVKLKRSLFGFFAQR